MLATCSQDDLLRMIQTIGVPTFAMDVLDDDIFHYACINSRLEEITVLSTLLVQGRSPTEILAPAQAAAVEQRVELRPAARGTGIRIRTELRGTHRWLRVVLVPLFDQAGRIVRLMGTVNDVTEQKRAEQDLLRTHELYRELWRKLGDDEVRKAAYRGRCLKPA